MLKQNGVLSKAVCKTGIVEKNSNVFQYLYFQMTLDINKLLPEDCRSIKEWHKGNKTLKKTLHLAGGSVEGMGWSLQLQLRGDGSFQSRGTELHFNHNLKEYSHDYTQSPNGKLIHAKAHAKRHRGLGYEEINEPFEGHHIDKSHVIHIPKELHRSISHNVWTGKGMAEINDLAQEFLLAELGEC